MNLVDLKTNNFYAGNKWWGIRIHKNDKRKINDLYQYINNK